MVVDKTLYDVLGVEPNATQETISQACRTKSREHHPDRGGSHEMMQQVNAAREILTDPSKREIYDRYGLKGMQSRLENDHFPFPGASTGIFDIFDLFNRGSSHRNNDRTSKGNDIKHVLKVSLEELYLGTTKTIQIDRNIVCNNCKGTGCRDGVSRPCTRCNGAGIEVVVRRTGPFMQQIQRECSLCNGSGDVIEKNNRCKTCSGRKVVLREKSLDVNIVHGSEDGEVIKFLGEANQIPNGESGTVDVILKEESHRIFIRKKENLMMKMEINLTECLCGFQRLIQLLDGHQILINHPSGQVILPNSLRSLKGYGMPNRQEHSYGDLIIQFHVTFPDQTFHLTEIEQKQLESILPPKKRVRLNSDEHYEEGQLAECEIPKDNDHHQQQFEDQNFREEHHTIPCQMQ